MKKITVYLLLFVILSAQVAFAQEKVDESVMAKIKTEAMEKSKAMETLGYMSDVFGPRLTGSPNLTNAQNWLTGQMKSWGLDKVHVEEWGTFGHGWNLEKFSAEMTAPTYDRLMAYPLAWSPAIEGTLTGSPIVVVINPKTADEDYAKYRGKLKGAIVMSGNVEFNKPETRAASPVKRFTEEELKAAANEKDAAGEGINGGSTTNYEDEDKGWQEGMRQYRARYKFFKDEGVGAVLTPSSRPNGLLSVQGLYDTDPKVTVPSFVVAREQYARMLRLTKRNVPVKLEISMKASFQSEVKGSNIMGEITGTDPKLKDEVVLLGAHFDSWHAGTGATDNGAGCMAVLEALRILKAVGVKPRRTIRVGLWDGEEQSYYGSVGYAKKHYGNPDTKQPGPEHDKLSAYYNLDNGTGRIRGVFLQGNEAVRPIFDAYLKPFNSVGASTLSILNTGGTDHMVFDAIGLPGFQFIQDPVDYNSRTHHTNLDVLEAVNEEDLKVNAMIIAAFAYNTAMRDEKLPRKTK